MSEDKKGFEPQYDDNKNENTTYFGKAMKNRNGSEYRKGELFVDQSDNYPEEMVSFLYTAVQSLGELIVHQTDILALQRNVEALIDLLTHCLGLEKKEQDFLKAKSILENKYKRGNTSVIDKVDTNRDSTLATNEYEIVPERDFLRNRRI